MKKKLILGSILALTLGAMGVIGNTMTKPVQMTHQYRCTDRNQSLYFLVYEVDGKLDRGLMYVENMQVANMTVEQAGTDVIKAKVIGDAANVGFQLFKTGKILVANYQTNSRVEVCKCSYAFK
jgi:hypothetical protein